MRIGTGINPLYASIMSYARLRENVRLAKDTAQPKPWTSDAILQQYKFCNVFRMDDTVTRWMYHHIIKAYQFDQYLPAILALCRWINHVDCLEDIMFTACVNDDLTTPQRRHQSFRVFYNEFIQQDFSRIQRVIRTRMNAKLPAWTGAYMIRAESNRKQLWYDWPKEKYITEIVVAPVVEMCSHHDRTPCGDWRSCMADIGFGNTIEETTNLLALQYGWGHFMAYEVATDLTYAHSWLANAPDLRTWANAGPGAVRGLNRIHGRELTSAPKKAQTLAEMVDILPAFDITFSGRVCCLRDVEHTLCEFDKYERVRLGQGRPRSKYNGT